MIKIGFLRERVEPAILAFLPNLQDCVYVKFTFFRHFLYVFA